MTLLYESLLALDLPATVGPPLDTPALEGLERWLFTGSWHRRASTCTLSSAVVLARVLHSLRSLGSWKLAVQDDADTLLDLPLASPSWGEQPASWPERLPERWTDQPCDFQLSATRVQDHGADAITLRYQPRHDAETGPLVAAVRVAWSAPADDDSAQAGRDLAASLARDPDLARLAAALEQRGHGLAHDLGAALGGAFQTEPSIATPTLCVLHGLADHPNAFADRLVGLGSDAARLAAAVATRAMTSSRSWPALDHRGVPGRLAEGRFHPNTLTEVTDAL